MYHEQLGMGDFKMRCFSHLAILSYLYQVHGRASPASLIPWFSASVSHIHMEHLPDNKLLPTTLARPAGRPPNAIGPAAPARRGQPVTASVHNGRRYGRTTPGWLAGVGAGVRSRRSSPPLTLRGY